MNSDIEDMGLILVESTFRHRKEVERLEETLLKDRRVKYFNTLNDITADLQDEDEILFLLDDFIGPTYKALMKRKPPPSMLGPPAFIQKAKDKENEFTHTPNKQIYTFALAGRNFVQGGNPQEETYLLKRYIRSLGGQCRQNIDEKATFLVTTNLKSTKYDRANAFDIPVIKRQSIYDAWEQRANPKFEFNDKFYKKYIYDCFYTHKIRFYGFDKTEEQQLVKNLIENGGEHAANDDDANYIVIPSSIKTKPDKLPIPTLRPVFNYVIDSQIGCRNTHKISNFEIPVLDWLI